MPRSDHRFALRRIYRRRLVATGALAVLERVRCEEVDLEPRGRPRGRTHLAVTDGFGSIGG